MSAEAELWGGAALDDALDALESMVTQYLDLTPDGAYDHASMAAGEEACEVLTRLRPDRWRTTTTGMERS